MFRMLIATPLHYLGVVFKDFYFPSGVLPSISNNYNKYNEKINTEENMISGTYSSYR